MKSLRLLAAMFGLSFFLSFAAFADVAIDAAAPAAKANPADLTQMLLQMTSAGSTWVLWLLLALSVLSLAVIAERTLFFVSHRVDLTALRAEINDLLVAGDWDGAAQVCRKHRSFEARVGAFAIANRNANLEAGERMLESFIAADKRRLDAGLTFLGTLGNNAPFIGLFGTVLGIIEAFHALAANPGGGAAIVMSGISEALVTTAVGLAVAIPAVIAFNTFQRLVKTKLEGALAIQGLVLGHTANRARTARHSA